MERFLKFGKTDNEDRLIARVTNEFTEVDVTGAREEMFRRFISSRNIADLASLVSGIKELLDAGEFCELLPEDFSPPPEEEVVSLVLCCGELYHRHFMRRMRFLAVL